MKKLFILFTLITYHLSLLHAQDSLVFKNGKTVIGKVVSIGKEKVIYMVPPDSLKKVVSNWRLQYIRYSGGTEYNFSSFKKPVVKTSPSELYLAVIAGFSVPSLSYRDGIVGTNFGARATYYFNSHFGIAAAASIDYNGTGLNYISSNYFGGFYIFQQYLAGVSYRVGGKPGYPWVDFVGLFGVCNATSPVSESGGGLNGITVHTPGNGNGYGGYIGLDFTSSEDHVCAFTFGVGCLVAVISYPQYSTTYTDYNPTTNSSSSTVSKGTSPMTLALPEMYFALSIRAKKAQR